MSFVVLAALAGTAHAVVVRGVVTDPLGRPIPGATIRLIQGQRAIASDISGIDGSYEIRSSASGRFVTLTTAAAMAPGIGLDFYGGRTSVIERNLMLDPALFQPPMAMSATGMPTSLAQTASAVSFLSADDLRTRVDLQNELRLTPGTSLVQTGQAGSFAGISLRGGSVASNRVAIDGVTAEDMGGNFDFGTMPVTAVNLVEVDRGANSALYGADAEAGVVALTSARGTTLHPVLDYTGEAGNLHTWHNEAVLSGTRMKLDYLAAYARFDTSNALRLDQYHASTAVANIGYALATNTTLRFTLRNIDAASGVPGPYDIYGVSTPARKGDQNLYAGLTLENRIAGNWHTVARYGIARQREQLFDYAPVGQAIGTGAATRFYTGIFTLRGANGYIATGRAAIDEIGPYPSRQDSVSNRDELSVQSDYAIGRHVTALLGLRYTNERGVLVAPNAAQNLHRQRLNFGYSLGVQGDIVNRVFFSAAGSIEKNHLAGLRGNPRLGIAYVPVRPGTKWFRGTKVHASAATGFREPSLSDEASSLYDVLLEAGDTASIARYRVTQIDAPRSRSFDLGVDQNILRQKLVLRASYFHNQFSHQIDAVDAATLKTTFGIASLAAPFIASLNTGAYRAQGIETTLAYQPRQRLLLHGGYTYLAGVVEHAFAPPAINPNMPGIAIGASSPLVGARPFRQPPHTGFVALVYTGTRFAGALESSMASRSDDSTFLAGRDINGGNTLLLPNRNLDFGYVRLDAGFSYSISHRVTIFTHLENLLNQQHMAPIGSVSLPLTVRSGLKLRLGRE